jgi:hypothetical protein
MEIETLAFKGKRASLISNASAKLTQYTLAPLLKIVARQHLVHENVRRKPQRSE